MTPFGIANTLSISTMTIMPDLNSDSMVAVPDSYIESLLAACRDTAPQTAARAGPFKTQAEAFAAGPIVAQVRYKGGEFWAYQTQRERAQHCFDVSTQSSDAFNERVNGSEPFAFVIDFDGPPGMDDAAREVLAAATSVLIEYGADAPDIATFGYDNATKTSRHFVAQGCRVRDAATLNTLTDIVRARVSCPDMIDKIGSMKTFGLRLPGCAKDGDTDRILSCDAHDDPWLQIPGDVSQIIDVPASEVAARSRPALEDTTTGSAQEVHEHATELETFCDSIKESHPHFVRDAVPDSNTVASFSRVRSAHCSACDRTHDERGAFVTYRDGVFYLICRRGCAVSGTPPLKVFRTASAPDTKPDTMPEHRDEFEGIAPDETADAQYNADAFAHILKLAGLCDIYTRSRWKTGKTVFAGLLIKALIKLKPSARIAIITCRKTLTSALVADFGAADYRYIKGEFNEAQAMRYPISVWQIESLPRISSELSAFDLVIVDEPGAAFAHIYQPNASTKARSGMTKARQLIAKASSIYVCDNDLSAAHVAAFQKARPEKPSRVLVNNFRSWEGVTANISRGDAAPTVVRHKLFEYLNKQDAARLAGEAWYGCVVPCHSRKIADGIAADIALRYGDTGPETKLYTSETDQHTKATDFADATTAWSNTRAIIYTGTVSVGISANTNHIPNAFAFFSANNAGTAQSAQMIFRARELKHIEIAYDGHAIVGLPIEPARVLEWVTLAHNRSKIPDQFRSDCSMFIHAATESDPKALGDLVQNSMEGSAWMCDVIDRNRSARWFIPRMVRLLEDSGCVVTNTYVGELTEHASTVTGIEEIYLDECKHQGVAMSVIAECKRDRIAATEFTPAMLEYIDRVESNIEPDDSRLLTANEIQGQRAVHAVRVYGEAGGVSVADIQALGIDARAVWLAAYAAPEKLERYRALTDIVRDIDRIRTPARVGDVQTATTSRAEACAIVRRVCETIGATNALLTGEHASIDVAIFETPSEQLKQIVADVNKCALRVFGDTHGARRQISVTKKQTANKLATTLSVALKYVGARLKPTYETERDKDRRQNATGWAIQWDYMGIIRPEPRHPVAGARA